MSPSAGRIAPQHLMPYESELGVSMTLENLTWYVFHLEKRPSIPDNWELLPQVFFHMMPLVWTYSCYCVCLEVIKIICWTSHEILNLMKVNVLTDYLKLSGICAAGVTERVLGQ